MYIKLIKEEAFLLIGDYRYSKGASNLVIDIEGNVGARYANIRIKLADYSTQSKEIGKYLARPIQAIIEGNRTIKLKDVELFQVGKEPLTIEGKGWLV